MRRLLDQAKLRSKSLLVRTYVFGILTMAMIFAVILIEMKIFRGGDFDKMNAFAIWELTREWENPMIMRDELNKAREKFDVRITVYKPNDEMVCANHSPPFPPLDSVMKNRLKKEKNLTFGFPSVIAAGIEKNGKFVGYGIFTLPNYPPSPKSIIPPVAILLLIGILSVVFSLSISMPINRLKDAAKAFGRGDFKARSGIDGKDEIGFLAKTFDEMADRVTHLIDSQKALVVNVSHELRTPLSRIRVALEMAEEEDFSMDGDQIRGIMEDLSDLEKIVRDVLTTARLDLENNRAMNLPVNLERLEPGPFLGNCEQRLKPLYRSHELNFELDENLPEIMADPVLLNRVVNNLVDNASKYSPAGSPITLRARSGEQSLVVEIADRGPGIDESDLKHVFTPFFRAEKSRSRSTGGVGLGLTLCSGIIRAHNGEIEIQSTPGEGTCVRFVIPAILPV